MYHNIIIITMLFFVAAAMFTFASCDKDDDNNIGIGSGSSSSIDESKLIGVWHFENADYQHCNIIFNLRQETTFLPWVYKENEMIY